MLNSVTHHTTFKKVPLLQLTALLHSIFAGHVHGKPSTECETHQMLNATIAPTSTIALHANPAKHATMHHYRAPAGREHPKKRLSEAMCGSICHMRSPIGRQ